MMFLCEVLGRFFNVLEQFKLYKTFLHVGKIICEDTVPVDSFQGCNLYRLSHFFWVETVSCSGVSGSLRLQASLFMGLLFPSPGDLPDPGIEPGSLALQADSLTYYLLGKPPFWGGQLILLIYDFSGKSFQ